MKNFFTGKKYIIGKFKCDSNTCKHKSGQESHYFVEDKTYSSSGFSYPLPDLTSALFYILKDATKKDQLKISFETKEGEIQPTKIEKELVAMIIERANKGLEALV